MTDRRDFMKQAALASAALHFGLQAQTAPTAALPSAKLPDEYFRRLNKWCAQVKVRLGKERGSDLKMLEAEKGWYHFPYTVLSAAVLYAKQNPQNPAYKDPAMLRLALDIGDFIAREDKQGTFAPRLDSYRDTYMWLEAYALLKNELGAERQAKWAQSLERNVSLLLPELAAWRGMPAYTENFIGTSPNHYAWWAATAFIGGIYLNKRDWTTLGGSILKRFAASEQNPDGYWGEHNPNSPTGGYNYLTTLAVGVFYEHTKDEDALKALQRATVFHSNYTYPDGNLVELFNDRNRYWHISPWGQFAFSHFPEGRGYAEMLTRHIEDSEIDLDALGMIAQNALYYVDGLASAPPPEQPNYVHRLQAEGGIRKRGPWIAGLCGIVDTPLPRSQWFLDHQANLSLFHTKTGLIVSGAQSKHQPELATFSEKVDNEWIVIPKGSRLSQTDAEDALAVGFNSFSAEIFLPAATATETEFRVAISGRGPVPQEAYFALQIWLKQGSELKTGSGRTIKVSESKIDLSTQDIAGSISHNGWTLKLEDRASLQWPIYPYNPYRNARETVTTHAVALLRIPLDLKKDQRWLRPNERTIRLKFQVPEGS